MSIKTFDYVTPGWLECANQILCGSAASVPVILSLIDDRAVAAPSGCPQNSILASLVNVVTVPTGNSCAGVNYKYTLSYDDVQTGGITLVTADITGIICDSALARWVRDDRNYFSRGGFLQDTGATNDFVISVETALTDLPDSHVQLSLENDSAVFGPCRQLMARAELHGDFAFTAVEGTHFAYQYQTIVNGVAEAWQTLVEFWEVLPDTGTIHERRQFNIPVYTGLVDSGDDLDLSVDFRISIVSGRFSTPLSISYHFSVLNLLYWAI